MTVGIGALTFGIIKGRLGLGLAGVLVTFGLAVVLLALFVGDCLRSANPFVDPALFRIRQFAGATLVMAPYSIGLRRDAVVDGAVGADGWGWSALKTGLAIAPGPLMVPVTSLLLAGRLIARFGAAGVIAPASSCLPPGSSGGPSRTDLEPNIGVAMARHGHPTGVGVGLTFPTLMGVGTAALPPSSFATGSGVINMIRQSALAVGVAIFVAVVGAASSPAERVAAFHRGWWLMAAITALGLIPTVWLIRRPPPSR